MQGIMRVELRRAFLNRRFWIIGLLTLLCLGAGWYRAGQITTITGLHPVNLLMNVLFYTPFALLAALFATLPFADSLLDDRSQGFVRYIALRTPYRNYLYAKGLAVGLAGGVSVGAALLLMLGLLFCGGQVDLGNRAFVSLSTLAPTEPWGPLGWLYGVEPFYYLGYLLLSGFLFGVVYALVGLAVSTLIPNRYVALAAPLVIFQLFSYLEERSLRWLPAWNPLYSLYPFEAYQGFGLLDQGLQYSLILLAAWGCLALFARRSRGMI